ncbi:hypothetical protein N9164_10705 [Draconibacterium sp.]|nr:hypothetical protein [Draconibacterium sp.]
MAAKLKRDQIPKEKAINWRKSLKKEEKLTFNLKVSRIILQKETYKILAGENENRVRVYLGLESAKKDGKYELCAYAVSAFLLGSVDVYVDYETPVYKLENKNIDYSANTEEVLESIRRYRSWREGAIEPDAEGAQIRKYIYPKAYLLTKYELHEIFNVQNKDEALIELGISKTMKAMISPVATKILSMPAVTATEGGEGDDDIYNDVGECPPYCDDNSMYNS